MHNTNIIFKTENSTYEIDQSNKKVRRIVGKSKTTLRQTNDWKNYKDITFPVIGKSVVIIWDFIKNNDNQIIAQSTQTSAVIQIENGISNGQ